MLLIKEQGNAYPSQIEQTCETPSPDSNTNPVVDEKENKERGGWFPKTNEETPYFSNNISEILSRLFLGFNIGSVINKGWLGISSDSKPNSVKIWLNIRDISLSFLKAPCWIG